MIPRVLELPEGTEHGFSKERGRDRSGVRQRQRERMRERERDRERDRDKERERQTERERDRERQRQRDGKSTSLTKSKLSWESRVVLPVPVGPVKITSSPSRNPLVMLVIFGREGVGVPENPFFEPLTMLLIT
jgi:hypothetical protein